MTTDKTVSHAKPKAPKKAKPSAADQVAKMRQTVLAIGPQPAPVELVMMPVELIECAAQVRTEFNDESLAELAADVACRGVLQPVLLRPIEGGRYLVIAGERRLRACVLAQLPTIPAIVGQIDDETAEDMQLAENIQREDLNLKDTAAAVKRLYKQLGSVQTVSEYCHKSKAWVSKHLSIADGLNSYASRLLADGVTEDLETLKAVSALEALTPGTNSTWALCEKIRAGKAGRTAAREALAEAKDAADPVKKAQRWKEAEEQRRIEADKRTAESQERAAKAQAAYDADAPERLALEMAKLRGNPTTRLRQIERELAAEDTGSVGEIVDKLGDEVQEILRNHLKLFHISGTAAPYSVLLRMHAQGEHSVCEMAAFMAGMASNDFDFAAILTAVREAMKGEE